MKTLPLLITAFLSLAAVAAPPGEKAILDAAMNFLQANSEVEAPGLKLEAVSGNFARVKVVPMNGETDPATMFLEKKDGTWTGLVLGTAFTVEDYEAYRIPKKLQLD